MKQTFLEAPGKRRFFWGIALLTFLQCLDLLTTWILTPDLEEEANAFVSFYGFGWLEIILVSIAVIIFAGIPYYFHCRVLPFSEAGGDQPYIQNLRNYFFKNHHSVFISFLRVFFSGIGFYFMWWFIVVKISAIVNNGTGILNLKWAYSELSFEERMELLDRFDLWSGIIIVMIGFLIILINAGRSTKQNVGIKKRFSPFLPLIFTILYVSFLSKHLFLTPVHSVNLTNFKDERITIINIGGGDRRYIGEVLSKLSKYSPKVVGVDILFEGQKDPISDSILQKGLKDLKHDVLAFAITSGKFTGYNKFFSSSVEDFGILKNGRRIGLVSRFYPVVESGGVLYENFALKIARKYDPTIKTNFKANKAMRINYTRNRFHFVDADALDLISPEMINNKIVLVGDVSTGEDIQSTPVSRLNGIYIIWNEITTLLEMKIEN